MKEIQKLAKLAILTYIITILACFCPKAKCENAQHAAQLTRLTQQVDIQTGAFLEKEFIEDVASFTTLIQNISFEPAFELPRDKNATTLDGSAAIRGSTDIVIAMLRSEIVKNADLDSPDNPALKAIDMYVEKLDSSIDPNWKWIRVFANVGPPPGTPNAASGMNPDAIADPELKQQYLDLIKKNHDNGLINSQQSELRTARTKFLNTISTLITKNPGEGWNKNDAIARFCKNEESRIFLEEKLR